MRILWWRRGDGDIGVGMGRERELEQGEHRTPKSGDKSRRLLHTLTWHIEDEEWVWVVLEALRELLRNSIGGFTFSSFIASFRSYDHHLLTFTT